MSEQLNSKENITEKSKKSSRARAGIATAIAAGAIAAGVFGSGKDNESADRVVPDKPIPEKTGHLVPNKHTNEGPPPPKQAPITPMPNESNQEVIPVDAETIPTCDDAWAESQNSLGNPGLVLEREREGVQFLMEGLGAHEGEVIDTLKIDNPALSGAANYAFHHVKNEDGTYSGNVIASTEDNNLNENHKVLCKGSSGEFYVSQQAHIFNERMYDAGYEIEIQ